MFKIKGKINLILLVFNIFPLLYYSIQLLAFTDEFVLSNIGFFNHAVAGLSEIIGIIFFCLATGLSIIVFRGANNQLPLLTTVFLMQTIISLNFVKNTNGFPCFCNKILHENPMFRVIFRKVHFFEK